MATCERCGKALNPRQTRFCGHGCYHAHDSETSQAAFWERVDKTPDCWIWIGSRVPRGYGRIRIRRVHHYAHRMAWQQVNGPIPEGMIVMHRCDNPPCVRPDHLQLGTPTENTLDMKAKGRARSGRTNRTGRPKLTMEAAREIRRLGGTHSQGELAKMFGVSRRAVGFVLSGQTWREAA